MADNQKLIKELYALRSHLKIEGKYSQGRVPKVCSDEALYMMAELRPKKLSDFLSVPGIGQTFIDTYGDAFLHIIQKYELVSTEKAVELDTDSAKVLKELEKKLVNINRKNRLLYLPKCASKYAVDMYSKDNTFDPLSIIFGTNRFVTISSISVGDAVDFSSDAYLRQKRFSSVLRESNKLLKEKGQNDLYIGYPFVKGRLPGENFDIRCPLALFPVEQEVSPTSIKLKIDVDRDALYNTTLLLAYCKFNNIIKELPVPEMDSYPKNIGDAIADILSFFSDNSITIRNNNAVDLEKFIEYKSGEFPHYQPGELYLEPCMVLGTFPVCASSIQKDFDSIISSGEINPLLEELLTEKAELEYGDFIDGEKEASQGKGRELDVSEHDLSYVNELNSSQETVLKAIEKGDKLVVQGPPGTGKSQMITSLIADFVAKGKTVLMVSEKKTALDVVYSRLGELSKYALMLDDVGDKDLFYKQLQNMLFTQTTGESKQYEIDSLSNKVDEEMQRLQEIATILYGAHPQFGIEPYKVYAAAKRPDMADEAQREKAKVLNAVLSEEIISCDFSELTGLREAFNHEGTLQKLDEYSRIIKAYPWLSKFNANLNEYDLIQFEEELSSIKESINSWRAKNFIVRLLTKGKVRKAIGFFSDKYFVTSNKDITKLIFSNTEEVLESANVYAPYESYKPLFERLTEIERHYFGLLQKVKEECNQTLLAANDALYNQALLSFISRFEAENRLVFESIDNFYSIIENLTKAIKTKQKLTKEKLQSILNESLNAGLLYSKRHGEILRAIEGKRRPSVNRFIKKFDFEIFKSIRIWLLTPEVVSEIIPLQKGVFDLVVFDEASQMYIEKGVPSILRGKKVIIAGDHKQLRPTRAIGAGRAEIDTDDLPEDVELGAALEEESLLDLARFKYDDILLNFHYRSKYEELIAFSNHAFYQGRLYVSPNTSTPEKPPIEVHKIDNAMWQDATNLREAEYVINLIKQILAERKGNESIGVITFNIKQRDLIDDLIEKQTVLDAEFAARIRAESNRSENGQDTSLFVKNIESVQGDERDIIIFSIGYAKNSEGRFVRNFGWLNQQGGENRLNVAISRAREKVHIVTSFDPEELQVEDTKNEGPRVLKKYLQYAAAISSGNKESAKQVLLSFGDENQPGSVVTFDSPFEVQVYNALREKGYSVDTQIGIGGYSIDLAIKRNGKYVLGIECDGRLYHSSKSARERDYHRQKYLESRGWRIHRIWSPNWWKNPQLEVQKICSIVDSF